MALKSPLMPSPNGPLHSAFSPYSDSPTSPHKFDSPSDNSSSNRSSHLNPNNTTSPLAASPSDIADPSPISSNGTNTTDIDDTSTDNEDANTTPPKSIRPDLELETKEAAKQASKPKSDEDEQPSSVIHAPQGFEAFKRNPSGSSEKKNSPQTEKFSPTSARRSTPTASNGSEVYITPPDEPSQKKSLSPVSPPPLQTTVAPARDWSATPRAQSRQDMENSPEEERRKSSRSSSRSSVLADIPETQAEIDPDRTPNPDDTTLFDHTVEQLQQSNGEVTALNVALKECWTLCNTLAGLSYVHRERIFSFSGKGDRQEQAWKSCWRLCQKLYETRDEEIATQVRPTLDLCREFCQCLFDIRRKDDEAADSVLRVSFELNNHLYNTHDRKLPEAYRERTLDFYITLCHRLMKQRSQLARETDSLLGACWSLAEMLFSLRQNKREGKSADEELLGSAVQACWELCDLFREGWTQIRPDRGTPRPAQTTFSQQQTTQRPPSIIPSVAESDAEEDDDFGRLNPETPTTIFEDTNQISPDDGPLPNILVLGPDQFQTTKSRPKLIQRSKSAGHHPTSLISSSTLTNPETAISTSSSSTIINPPPNNTTSSNAFHQQEDPHITCIHLLLIKAAISVGYTRPTPSSTSSSTTATTAPHPPLHTFVKSLPSNSFGTKTWQRDLLEHYKKLVATDPALRSSSLGPPRRARAVDVARSVRWVLQRQKDGGSGSGSGNGRGAAELGWLGDLYRWVFGFWVEEGEGRADVWIQS